MGKKTATKQELEVKQFFQAFAELEFLKTGPDKLEPTNNSSSLPLTFVGPG